MIIPVGAQWIHGGGYEPGITATVITTIEARRIIERVLTIVLRIRIMTLMLSHHIMVQSAWSLLMIHIIRRIVTWTG